MKTFAKLVNALALALLALPAFAGTYPPLQDYNAAKNAVNNGLIPAVAAECTTGQVLTYTSTTNQWACASVASGLTAGAGLLDTSGTWSTASNEAGFVLSGALTCGSTTTHGEMKVHTTPALQYCSNETTNTLRYTALGDAKGNALPVVQTVTVADSGDGSAATATLTVTSSVIEVTCSDSDGCAVTLSESGAVDGFSFKIFNVSANAVTLADTSGVSETTGALSLGQWDNAAYTYIVDRWVQSTGVVNN